MTKDSVPTRKRRRSQSGQRLPKFQSTVESAHWTWYSDWQQRAWETLDYQCSYSRLPLSLFFSDLLLKEPRLEPLDLSFWHCGDLELLQLLSLRGLNKKLVRNIIFHGSFTTLSDAGLAHLSNFSNLQTLRLPYCRQLTDAAIISLRNVLSHLTLLDLSYLSIGDEGLESIARYCHHLRHLNVSGTAVSSLGLGKLAAGQKKFNSLQSLSLKHCKGLSDEGVAELFEGGKFHSLTELSLAHCPQLSDLSFISVPPRASASLSPRLGSQRIHQLVSLELQGLTINSLGIEPLLRACRSLVRLDLSSCQTLGDEALHALAQGCGALEEFDISNNGEITDEGFLCFLSLPSSKTALRVLNISCCFLLGEKCFTGLGRHTPSLTEICARGLPRLSNAAIEALTEGCRRLEKCDIGGVLEAVGGSASASLLEDVSLSMIPARCSLLRSVSFDLIKVNQRTMTSIARHLSCLQELSLAGCSHVLDSTLLLLVKDSSLRTESDPEKGHVACSLSSLRKVDLSRCKKLTNDAISIFVGALPNLRTLLLNGCTSLGDKALEAIARSCPRLTALGISRCVEISDDGVLKLLLTLPGLKHLNLSHCCRISSVLVEGLRKRFPPPGSFRAGSPVCPLKTLQLAGTGVMASDVALLAPSLPYAKIEVATGGGGSVSAGCKVCPLSKEEKRQSQFLLLRLRESQAARTIQCGYRWHRTRLRIEIRRLKREKERKEAQELALRRETAAILFQNIYRGWRERRAFRLAVMEKRARDHQKTVEASLRLVELASRLWIRWRRQRERVLAFEREQLAQEVRRQELAARVIQAQWRRKAFLLLIENSMAVLKRGLGGIIASRREVKLHELAQRRDSAAIIHRALAAYHGRKEKERKKERVKRFLRLQISNKRLKKSLYRFNVSATKVQRAFLAYRCRKTIDLRVERRRAGSVIQRAIRAQQERKKTAQEVQRRRKKITACIIIQRTFRCRIWLRALRERIESKKRKRESDASKRLQALFRGHRTRQDFYLRRAYARRTAAAIAEERERTVRREEGARSIQRWFRSTKELKKLRWVLRYRREMSATMIQRVYRGYLARRYVKELRSYWNYWATKIQALYRRGQARKKFRSLLREARAHQREKEGQEKAEKLQKLREAKILALFARSEERAARRLQVIWRARQMAKKNDETRSTSLPSAKPGGERDMSGKESDLLSFSLQGLTFGKTLLSSVKGAMKSLSQTAKPKRDKEDIKSERDAVQYALLCWQLRTMPIKGILALAVTVGMEETERFRRHLAIEKATNSWVQYEKDLDTGPRNRPKEAMGVFLWLKYGAGGTQLFTSIQFVRRPHVKLKKEEAARMDALTAAGFRVIQHEKLPWEIHCRSDGRIPITDLQLALTEEEEDHLVALSYVQPEGQTEPLDEIGLPCTVWIYRLTFEKSWALKRRETELQKKPYFSPALLQVVESAALTEFQVEEVVELFHKLDADGSGAISKEEFLHYLELKSSPIIDGIFGILDDDGNASVDLVEFVRAVPTICMLGRQALLSLCFNLLDLKKRGYIDMGQFEQLMLILCDGNSVFTAKQVEETKAFIESLDRQKLGKYPFETFNKVVEKIPALCFPIFRVQEVMRNKLLGMEFWTKKLKLFEQVRKDMIKTMDVFEKTPQDHSAP